MCLQYQNDEKVRKDLALADPDTSERKIAETNDSV